MNLGTGYRYKWDNITCKFRIKLLSISNFENIAYVDARTKILI